MNTVAAVRCIYVRRIPKANRFIFTTVGQKVITLAKADGIDEHGMARQRFQTLTRVHIPQKHIGILSAASQDAPVRTKAAGINNVVHGLDGIAK